MFIQQTHLADAKFIFFAFQIYGSQFRRIERYISDRLSERSGGKIEILERFADENSGRVNAFC